MRVFDDSHSYLNSSIRTYVNAKTTLDKLFAIKLVVLSMIVIVDKLIEKTGKTLDTSFHGHFEESNLFLPMAAYDQRCNELTSLEEKEVIPSKLEFSRRLRKALDVMKVIHGEYSLRSLLAVNIKEFINDALFFILDIQMVLEEKMIEN